MEWLRQALAALGRYREAQEREMRRLTRMHWESERLRAELSHLEREIHDIQESPLPRRHKDLLEAAIRIRYRKVEIEMLHRQGEITASGHLPAYW